MIKKLWEFAQIISDAAKSPKTKETLAKTKAILSDLFSKEKRVKIWKYNWSRRQFMTTLALAWGLIAAWDWAFSPDPKKPKENSTDDPSFIHHFIDKDIIGKLPKTWNEEFDNFWSNPDYFINVPKDDDIESRTLDNWYFIKDDAWLKFWAVQKSQLADIDNKQKTYNDNIKNNKDKKSKRDIIIEELSEFKEFEYLKWPEYKEKIRSFNTWNNDIPINASMPIPLQVELRSFTNKYFLKCAKLWIQTILKHPKYWPKIQKHMDRIWINEFAKNLTALARNESTIPGEDIWYYEFHRYEDAYQWYSYSPFHIMMTKWFEWFDAAKLLWISEWQTYHPFFASILACVYLCNKTIWEEKALELCPITQNTWNPERRIALINFFPIRKETKNIIARLYNWPDYESTWQNYDQRLLDNLNSL